MIGNIPYTPRVKKVLALAAKEAKALNHTYVGTEHILLGLLREGDGVAARVSEEPGRRYRTNPPGNSEGARSRTSPPRKSNRRQRRSLPEKAPPRRKAKSKPRRSKLSAAT